MSNAFANRPPPPRRVLIVDDDDDYTEALGDLLEIHGYVVTKALSGEAALCELASRPFDVVLLDMRMPGKCGIPLLTEMLEIDGELVVIVVTGYIAPGLAKSAKCAGAREVLTKPVPFEVLLSRIDVAVRRVETRA